MLKNETKLKKIEVLETTVQPIEQDDSMRPGRVLDPLVKKSGEYTRSAHSKALSDSDDGVPSELMGGRQIPKPGNINENVTYCPRFIDDTPGYSSSLPLPSHSGHFSSLFKPKPPTSLFPAFEKAQVDRNNLSCERNSDIEPMPNGKDHQFNPQ